jgi:DNA processing protein
VLANGLHRTYPSINQQLSNAIINSNGAVISEYEPGIEPMQYRFLERNRLISGLADAVVITEAAARSGSLNTAGHALNQGRELLVVPGNITSVMSSGCNKLLNQGALAVSSVDDILSALNIGKFTDQTVLPLGASPLEQKIIDLIAGGLRSGDQILAQSGGSASDFSVALSMLEINGIIKSLGANNWTLR